MPSHLSVSDLQKELLRLQGMYHSNCFFAHPPPISGLTFEFTEQDVLVATVAFRKEHQSYDGRVHGGLVAAIMDASMTQCLMGHSVIAYTVDLSIRYHKPVLLHETSRFEAQIRDIKRQQIFMMECQLKQGETIKAMATGRFFGEKVA